jgi:flagellar protein FlaG
MLIQNISSAVLANGFTSDSGPVPVAAPKTQAAPVDLPRLAVKAVVNQQAAQPTPAQLKNAVDNINLAMKQNNSNVQFSFDKDTNQTVIKVMDSQTGQLITQFPSKEALAISQMIGEAQHGALVQQKA